MKNVIKKGLLSVALLTAIAAQATNKIIVKTSNNKKVEIAMTSVIEGEVLSIVDTKDEVLYSEVLKEGNWLHKTLDFSGVPQGIYFVESKDTNKIEITPVVVAENNVTILKAAKKVFKAPSISLNDKIAKVLINNFTKSEVALSIFDSKGIEIYNTHNHEILTYSAFDLHNLPAGDYVITTTIDGYTFDEKITVK